ncbi:MAG: universal stress protein [Azospirillaceae bacterium]
MFKHILVPIDGSGLSLKAADLAIEQARLSEAKLTLLHVARKFPVPEALRRYLDQEHLTGEAILDIDEATHKLIKDVRRKANASGIAKVDTIFREGRPSRTIVEYAEHHRVDAIFMGCRGLTEVEGALLGSVSHKVASLAPCTVVIVR